jgi:very-short-patch-repair endonuclease
MSKSNLEVMFAALWDEYGDGSKPQHQHKFALHLHFVDKRGKVKRRQWALDFAWPEELVAVEIEGGVFTRGRHSRGAGMTTDATKYNHAALDGWLLLRYTILHLRDEPMVVVAQIRQALEMRRANK